MLTLPSLPGTYLLIARLDRDVQLRIGRLGTFLFRAGWYAYVGSAMGPGGLRARLARHWRIDKRTHWHIDFMLREARLVQSRYVACPDHLECAWSAAVGQLPSAKVPVLGFGSSDCRCPAHLVYWPQQPDPAQLERALAAVSPAIPEVYPHPSGELDRSGDVEPASCPRSVHQGQEPAGQE